MANGEDRQIFHFATLPLKLGIGCAGVVLVACGVLFAAVTVAELRSGGIEEAASPFLAFGLLLAALSLLAFYARQTWTTRIELYGETITYISGKADVEGSLHKVAALKQFETESGHAYRIEFRDGKRIDFNSGI